MFYLLHCVYIWFHHYSSHKSPKCWVGMPQKGWSWMSFWFFARSVCLVYHYNIPHNSPMSFPLEMLISWLWRSIWLNSVRGHFFQRLKFLWDGPILFLKSRTKSLINDLIILFLLSPGKFHHLNFWKFE